LGEILGKRRKLGGGLKKLRASSGHRTNRKIFLDFERYNFVKLWILLSFFIFRIIWIIGLFGLFGLLGLFGLFGLLGLFGLFGL
jgi:hypothetical protein